MTFTAPNGQKVTTNVAIATTNKALTYRGVTFNFDDKGIDATKEKAIQCLLLLACASKWVTTAG